LKTPEVSQFDLGGSDPISLELALPPMSVFAVGSELPVWMAVIQPLPGITSHAENVDAKSE
jgi:hypothetical protein